MNQLSIKIDKVKKIFNNILTKETFEINNDVVKKIHGDDLVDCNYKIGGQLVDRLIITDKYIKSKPELQSKYPLLKLLFNKNVPKSYDEIIFDKVKLMDGKSLVEQQKINDLYNEIIMSDPILSLTDKLEREGIHAAQEYLNLHPAIIDEYPLELEILNEKYGIFNNGIIKR